jgi:photosystem II stability/assembly factor-like uncharacterized protein
MTIRRIELARAAGGAFALAMLLGAGEAAANGRFPAAGHIAVNPTDGAHIAVRTTYGILTTRDAGKSWDWICEQAVQWTGQYDPSIAVTADGTILAGIYDHLGVGHGDACAWSSPAPLVQKNVIDVSTERAMPSSAVVMTSNQTGTDTFVTELWASSDNATNWSQAGVDLPTDFSALTVDVAPSDAQRVYASGIRAGTAGVLVRSVDRGATWETLDIPGSDQNKAPYIAAIDPMNPQQLYVRLAGAPGKLLVSTDGGSIWSEAFAGMGVLKGFALSPDGAKILVGGETDGIWRASAADLVFSKVSDVGAQCLSWAGAGVYVCAAEFKDNFTVGLSTDEGATFEPVMHLSCIRGPLACDPGTDVGGACPAAWPATAEVIDQASCLPDAGVPDGGEMDAGANPGPVDGAMEAGCGCRVGSRRGMNAGLASAIALGGIVVRRLRRSAGSSRETR